MSTKINRLSWDRRLDEHQHLVGFFNTGDFLQQNILDEKLETFTLFPMDTYSKPRKNPNEWDSMFGTVNKFFGWIRNNEDANKTIANTFVIINYSIMEHILNQRDISNQCNIFLDLPILTNKLSDMLLKLDESIDLINLLRDYVRNNIKINMTKDAGKRSQDQEEYTIEYDECFDLTVICVLCKMLGPIFGMVMDKFSKGPKDEGALDSSLKEQHCLRILSKILNRHFDKLIDKLIVYIEDKIVRKHDFRIAHTFSGNTVRSMSSKLVATLFIRNFVNIHLEQNDGNLMKYSFSSLKSAVIAQFQAANKRPIYTRIAYDNGSGEEGNTSQLEMDSIPSDSTAETMPMIIVATNESIDRILKYYMIEKDLFDECVAHYERHPISPNSINQTLVRTFFGPMLGGAKSINYFTSTMLNMAVSAMQLSILTEENKHYFHLIPFLSCGTDDKISFTMSEGQQIITNSWKTSDYFKLCKTKFHDDQGINAWDSTMNAVVDFMVYKSHNANLPQEVYDITDGQNINGCTLKVPGEFIDLFCQYIYKSLDLNLAD